jgi:hypothetical protein
MSLALDAPLSLREADASQRRRAAAADGAAEEGPALQFAVPRAHHVSWEVKECAEWLVFEAGWWWRLVVSWWSVLPVAAGVCVASGSCCVRFYLARTLQADG